ncbi:MAG: hypothetical protein HKM95_13910 [Inquilinus sp.]|nr:hypothetical protein [Inquilinus sp.]
MAAILGTIIAAVALFLDITEPFVGSNRDAPASEQAVVEPVSLVVEFENKHKDAVVLASRGDAFFWYPGGGRYESGRFDFADSSGASLTELRLGPGEKRRVVATFYPVERVAALLRQGHTDLSLFIRGEGIDSTFSPNVAFTAESISSGYMLIELAPIKE